MTLADPSGTIHLLVVTPEEILVDVDALWVQVPTFEGMLGIWPDHDVLIAGIEPGKVSYATLAGAHHLAVLSGTLRVEHGQCAVLISAKAALPSRAVPGLQDDQLDALEDQLRDIMEEGQEDAE